MNYQIISLQDPHLKHVQDIYNHYVRHSAITYFTHLLSEEEVRKMVFFECDRYSSYAICDEDKNVVGFCILSPFNKKEGYNNTAEVTIYLKPENIGQGCGCLALKFIEKKACENNIHTLVAAITSKNIQSINLFESCGYQKCAYFKEVGYKFGEILDDVYYQKIFDTSE